MPAADEAEAVAVLLPPPEAARVAVELWEAGDAVVPLDPGAPGPDLRRSLDILRPTALIDADGRRRLRRGVPVAAGVAAIVATSGTTGERKGVELTFSGLAASGEAVVSAVGGDARRDGHALDGQAQAARAGNGQAPDAHAPDGGAGHGRARNGWVCCLPVHLVAGLAVVGRAWATGACVTVHRGFDPAALGDAARGGTGFVSLVPTMLRRLLDSAPDAAAAFDHILLGGGSIEPALVVRAREAGATVSTTYGMTETWGGVVHNGHPLPGVELRLDRPPDDGDIGEILVRAPMLMRGYRLWPEGTAAAIDAGGWYRTGDLGRFDPDAGGRLWMVDRLGDVVNTGGVKVSPTEVERALAGHPAVADVCVAGRPDPDWGQRVVAFIVPADPSAAPTLADLRAFARDHLAAAKLPRDIVVLPAIPRTPGGKPLRHLLPTDGLST